MRVYVSTTKGDTHFVDVESMEEIANIREHLDQKGVSIARETPLILSMEAPMAANPPDTHTPDVPKPTSINDLPPAISEKILVASNPDQQVTFYDSGFNVYYSASWLNFWGIDPPLPPCTLAYNRYWTRVEVQIVQGPQSLKHTSESTEGMSESETNTFSAELGVEAYGLSAKLTATFEQSITISASKSVSNEYDIEVPDGKVGVWILWQLTDEVVALDSSGAPLNYHGMVRDGVGFGEITFPCTVVAQGTKIYNADLTLFDK